MPVKYSIVMPAFNRGTFLVDVIKSYQDQTYKDWEMVIVDDGSTDNTPDIASAYAKQDGRIVFSRIETNAGVGNARAAGNRLASGDYIVVADSDDFPHPNRLDIVNTYISKTGADVFYSNVEIYNAQTHETKLRFFQPYDKDLLYYLNYIPNPAACYKKSAYLEVGGYDKNFLIGEDYDLWLSLADKNKSFVYCPESTVRMTSHPGSVRQKRQQQHKYFLELIRKKHNCPKINIDKVRLLANDETYKYFTQESHFNRWFG